MKMKRYLLLVSVLLMTKVYGYSLPAKVDSCEVINQNFINYHTTIQVNPNLPILSQLGSQVILATNVVCNMQLGQHVAADDGVLLNALSSSAFSPQNRAVMATNIMGLGISLHFDVQAYYQDDSGEHYLTNQAGCSADSLGDLTQSHLSKFCIFFRPRPEVVGSRFLATITATLVKLSDELNQQTGMVQTINNDQVVFKINQEAYPFLANQVVAVAIQVKKPTCTLRQTSYQLTLPPVTTKQLAQISDTAGEKEFSIDLTDCQPNTSVSLLLNDVYQSGSIQYGVLTNTGSASGVGVQLLGKLENQTDYQPLSFGDKHVVAHATAEGGVVNIPLKARYYRLTNGLVSGTVDSLASFTLSYD